MAAHGPYADTYARSSDDPEGFWLDAASGIDWQTPPTRALDDANPPFYRWFPDGVLNTSYNCLDRHVEAGNGDRTALIYDSPVTGTKSAFTYAELLREVEAFAGVLRDEGVRRGDRVVVYMPMIPRAVIAMLACARLGAVHSVVFGGFAAPELAVRIDDAAPKVLVTAHGGIEPTRKVPYLGLVARAIELTEHRPSTVIVAERRDRFDGDDVVFPDTPGVAWLDWDEAIADTTPAGPTMVAATDPLYVLYTSGTTGKPKGVVRDNGGHAVAIHWSMWNLYGIRPGDVWWCASDVGWVVGHSYIVYGPLLAGATTVLYEGKPVGTPDAGAFWRVIAEYGVKALFTAPTALRAVRKEDPGGAEIGAYDLSRFETLFCAGERLDPETQQWAAGHLDRPVVDNWWQTETGWPIATNPRGLEPRPIKPGSPSLPVPGYHLEVLDGEGNPVPAGTEGNLSIRLPMPPATLAGLWRDDDRFVSSYMTAFPGYYATGDSGYIDEDGYVYVLGRTDDVINVAGHRLSTGAMEAVVAQHPAVAECAVIGVNDSLKGQRPSGYVVLKAGAVIDPEKLRIELVAMVREQIGAVATFRDVTVVQGLPKTRSGKILRKTMRQMADGDEYAVPSTIEDPAVLDALAPMLRGTGDPRP